MKIEKRTVGKLLLTPILISLALFGCKKKEEQQPEVMPPQGMMGQQQESVVVVPDSVKGKWKAVKISVLDKDSQKRTEYVIPIGSEKSIEGSDLSVKVENFLPDFIMNGPVRTSASNEPKKAAAQVEILQGGKEIYKGWMFYQMKSPHDFQNPKYEVSLAGFVPAAK